MIATPAIRSRCRALVRNICPSCEKCRRAAAKANPSPVASPNENDAHKSGHHPDQLEMQHDGQRMLLTAKAADEIVCYARAECRQDAYCKIERRNAAVELLYHHDAGECNCVEDPLHRLDAFAQDEDRDQRSKYRRQVLYRLPTPAASAAASGRNKTTPSCQTGRGAAASNGSRRQGSLLPVANRKPTKPSRSRSERTRSPSPTCDLLDTDICQKERRRRQEHRPHAGREEFCIIFQSLDATAPVLRSANLSTRRRGHCSGRIGRKVTSGWRSTGRRTFRSRSTRVPPAVEHRK